MALFPPGDSLSGDSGHSGTCANLKADLSGIEQEVFCTLGTFTPPDSLVIDGGAHWGETLRLMELSLEDTVEIETTDSSPRVFMINNFMDHEEYKRKHWDPKTHGLLHRVAKVRHSSIIYMTM